MPSLQLPWDSRSCCIRLENTRETVRTRQGQDSTQECPVLSVGTSLWLRIRKYSCHSEVGLKWVSRVSLTWVTAYSMWAFRRCVSYFLVDLLGAQPVCKSGSACLGMISHCQGSWVGLLFLMEEQTDWGWALWPQIINTVFDIKHISFSHGE